MTSDDNFSISDMSATPSGAVTDLESIMDNLSICEDRRIDTMPGAVSMTDTDALEDGRSFGRSESSNIETVFPDGRYRGMVNGMGKPHGTGTMEFNDGTEYDGEWRDSKFEGEGVLTINDGESKYTGQFQKGKPHGEGCFVYANGEKYTGSWVNGKMDGTGVYEFMKNEKYDGQWKENKQHGRGKYEYESGCSYEGQWRNGVREGYGIFKQKKGEYAGDWSKDVRDGLGVYLHMTGELDIRAYTEDVAGEGVRYDGDRTTVWAWTDGELVDSSMNDAETYRNNTCIVSPNLQLYLDEKF